MEGNVVSDQEHKLRKERGWGWGGLQVKEANNAPTSMMFTILAKHISGYSEFTSEQSCFSSVFVAILDEFYL